jgi:arylsulfatase A-like enzyme
MNVIVVMSDTFRRDHIAACGDRPPWVRPGHLDDPFIHTPNLDRLAREAAVFDRFYVGSYPTVPCRTDLFTGRFTFPFRPWQPLEPEDVILSECLVEAGRTPAIIFDPPQLVSDHYNFTRGFASWQFVRGQHWDRFNVDPIPTVLPAAVHKLKNAYAMHLYLRNTASRRTEADWMCMRTMATALEWLERNRSRNDFLLWIDMWDPHEPFDAPPHDLARYVDPAYGGEWILYPRYGRADYMDDSERNHVRALYAGQVTLVDRALGMLLDRLHALRLSERTLLVFLTDHGHLFGEHGLQGKPTGPLGKLYEVTTRVPLMIRHPDGLAAGRRIDAIVQHADLFPTLLEAMDVGVPSGTHGRSLWPLLRGNAEQLRSFAVSGGFSREESGPRTPRRWYERVDGSEDAVSVGEPLTLTTDRWTYICPASGTALPELYDLENDPHQLTNVLAEHHDVARDLHETLIKFLAELGTRPERVALYRDADQTQLRPLVPGNCPVFLISDGRGHTIAVMSREEAEATLPSGGLAGSIESTTLATLRAAQPRALVHLHDQYYWAEDLL